MASYLMVALLSVLLTLALGRVLKNSGVLVIVAALVTAAIFQIFVYLDLKYLDPFFLIAFAVSSVLAGVVSMLTLVVAKKQKLRGRERTQ